jgi:hypothetical protein
MAANAIPNRSTGILDFKWKCTGKLQAARMSLIKNTFKFNEDGHMNKHNHPYSD